MSILLEKFYGELGWKVDKTGPAQFEKQKTGIANGLKKIAGLYTAAAGIVTGFVAVTNKETAATNRLAQSLGVSFELMHRWGSATQAAGIGAEGATTAITYLNRTIGNVKINPGQAESVSNALKLIGLNLKDVAGMDTEERFNTVVSALGNVEDQTTVTAAAFKLFGRGGGASFARLAQLARSQGKTIDEYVGRWRDLELQTDKSVKGAVDFTASASALKFAFAEVRATIAGYVGEALLPMLKGAREWIANNRELIRSKLAEWARGTVTWLSGVWHFVSLIGKAIGPLVSAFGGLGNVLRMSAIGYLAVKLAAATKGVKDLSIAFGGLTKLKVKEFFTGPGGVAGLAAIAMYALSDLWDSVSDISNDSWGNRIARQLLRISDVLIVWGAETFFGKVFGSDAERATFIAQVQKNLDNIYSAVASFFGRIADAAAKVAGAPMKAIAAFGKLVGLENTAYKDRPMPRAPAPADYFVGPEWNRRAPNYYKPQPNVTANITVNPSAGMDEKAIAGQVVKTLEKEMKKAVRSQTAAGVAQ